MNVPFLGARCFVRQWILFLRQQGRLLEELLVFYVNGYTRLLRSILVLLFSWCGSGHARRRPRQWLDLISTHLALCSRRLPSRRMETYLPWKSGHYFYEPLVLQYFLLCAVSASVFLGALDDEEFFVVEGSGESDSQVTCHQLVSVTHCSVDVM